MKHKPNQIVDFTTYYKHLTLTDNEFLYYKNVGNAIEYVECHYQEINEPKSLNPLVTNKTSKSKLLRSDDIDFLTISKNVIFVLKF